MYDYNEFYNRQIKLWGEDVQASLKDKTITIIGSGGLGSSLTYALGASGIGKINVVDFDDVSLSNIHRQISFNYDDDGKSKAKIAVEKIQKRSPFVKAEAFCETFEEYTKRGIKSDLILDGTDNLFTRDEIANYSKASNTPWIYTSVEAYHGYLCFFKDAEFSNNIKVTERVPDGITAPIVMLLAAFEANIALRYLAGLPVKRDFLYYFYFDENGEFKKEGYNLGK